MPKPDVSRRDFLRTASLGAAATGIVAVGGGKLLDASLTSGSSKSAAASTEPTVEASDIFAHISDASSGRMTIFVGDKAVSYTDRNLAQILARAAQ